MAIAFALSSVFYYITCRKATKICPIQRRPPALIIGHAGMAHSNAISRVSVRPWFSNKRTKKKLIDRNEAHLHSQERKQMLSVVENSVDRRDGLSFWLCCHGIACSEPKGDFSRSSSIARINKSGINTKVGDTSKNRARTGNYPVTEQHGFRCYSRLSAWRVAA